MLFRSKYMRIAITQKLYWFLDVLVEEDVYSHILVLQFPLLYGSGKTAELVRQPMFTSLLQAFKTFMIVICSSTAWEGYASGSKCRLAPNRFPRLIHSIQNSSIRA